jgi:hypothetical protein
MLNEKLIAQHQAILGITREEAIELIQADQEIDKGKKLFELDPELERGAKKARHAPRKTGTPTKREKKIDNDKRFLVDTLLQALNDNVGEIDIVNPEREITFVFNEKKYKITLSAPRS